MVNRVWLVPYLKGWSYDLTAQALVKHLSHRFEFRVSHTDSTHRVNIKDADLVVDFWWKGLLHKRFGRRVVKQVSSHRWNHQERYGQMSAEKLIRGHLQKTGGVLVPSVRLHTELAEAPFVALCPKGFHPETFGDYDMRGGDLTIGWAGAATATDKNVGILTTAAPDLRMADRCLTQEEMPDFYNGLDVIACASTAEGDPRPLIEGMACGCFPVTTDVGIVPDLVRHGDNGLVVERTPEAFAQAFQWCRENLEYVRWAGSQNALDMLKKRTWAHVAPAWGDAFDAAIGRAPPPYVQKIDTRETRRQERIDRVAYRAEVRRLAARR
jgi:glycosyltransferase involved in cell wall biosynthesis